jgi:hypothetical protein
MDNDRYVRDETNVETPHFKTLFLPFDPVSRHGGPCARGAIIGS